jgi:hypothetical protein
VISPVKENPFAAESFRYTYPEQEFELKGGMKRDDAIDSLKKQIDNQDEKKPLKKELIGDDKDLAVTFEGRVQPDLPKLPGVLYTGKA